jgi:hypothetical protein
MAITPTESVAFSNISTTTSPFTLKGGTYSFITRATSYGTTVQLQTLAPDGSIPRRCRRPGIPALAAARAPRAATLPRRRGA